MVSKGIRLAVLLLCWTTFIQAQSIDSDAFMQSTIENLQATNNFALDKIRFPWVEEIQFRTETRDMDFEQQEYTLRLSPSSIKVRRAQQALLNHYQNPPNVDAVKSNEQTIRAIYVDWLNLYFIDQERKLLDSLSLIWGDKKLINTKLMQSYEIDVQDLVRLEVDKNNLSLSQFELGLERGQLADIYDLRDKTLDHSKMISLEEIESTVEELHLMNNSIAVIDDELEYQYEKEGIQKEMQMEQAESRKFFDFGQLRYRGPHADLLEERISVGLGFSFPRSGNRKLKIAELMIEQQQLDAEHASDRAESSLEIAELFSELRHNLELARNYTSLIAKERVELQKLAKVVEQKQGYNPMVLLDIKESLLSRKVKQLEYEQDVYIDYIKLLSMLGKLSESPFVNYLKA